MDYEKKYKELVAKIKNAHLYAQTDSTKNVLEGIFPELAESEDEKIRKELLNAFQESEDSLYMVLTPHKRESFIAWLEKQGEKGTIRNNKEIPLSAWNEEDEMMLECVLDKIGDLGTGEMCKLWLKSLKDRVQPQSNWKPSEEMLEALYRVIPENVMEKSEDDMLLDKLYQGLKYGKVLSEK